MRGNIFLLLHCTDNICNGGKMHGIVRDIVTSCSQCAGRFTRRMNTDMRNKLITDQSSVIIQVDMLAYTIGRPMGDSVDSGHIVTGLWTYWHER